MESWLSWAIVLALGGALYYYYSQNNNRARQRGRTLQRTTNTKESVQWSDSEMKSKATAKAAKAKAPRKSAKKSAQEVGDKEVYLSAASSTAGADADDDLSPVASPSLGATTSAKAPSGRDVSDMLGPQVAPSVLKISASEKPARPSKPQQQRAETPTESKKQRQNKKKAEEAKAARDAAEQDRKKLLEKQLRTAREARGEPARNGLQTAQPPTSNPWNRAPAAPVQPVSGQLLDTIDTTSTASSSEAATNGTAPTPDSMSYAHLPSEEEQMRLAMEESVWTTVPRGKKQRKNKAGGGTAEEGSDSGAPHEPAPAPVKPVPVKKAENIKPASRYEILAEPTTDASDPRDSDWPVV